jgi:hypothetical protein
MVIVVSMHTVSEGVKEFDGCGKERRKANVWQLSSVMGQISNFQGAKLSIYYGYFNPTAIERTGLQR